jgi:hypothetical protein
MAAIRWNAKHPKAGLARIMRCEVSDHVLEMVENAAIWPMIPTAEYSGPVWQEVDNA